MEYIFSDKLKRWLKHSGMNRKDFICLLKKSNYDEFKGLDEITLSRWTTGKSTPPLYKQFFIAKYLNIDLVEFICEIKPSQLKVTTRVHQALAGLVSALETSFLSYDEVISKPICHIEEQSFAKHYNLFSKFNKNISSLEVFFDELYQLNDKVNYTSIILKNFDEKIIGHFSGIKDISPIKDTRIFKKIDKCMIDRSSLMSVAYYSSIPHYFELLSSALCYYILTASREKDYIYVFVPGHYRSTALRNLLNIKEEICIPDKKSDAKLNVYLFKIDIIKALCNPLLFSSVQKN